MEMQLHIGSEIKKLLNEEKRSISWLADEIGYDSSSLGKQLKKQHINPSLLYRICKAMDSDFFACYSKSLSDEANRKH